MLLFNSIKGLGFFYSIIPVVARNQTISTSTKMNTLLILGFVVASCLADDYSTYKNDYSDGGLGRGIGRSFGGGGVGGGQGIGVGGLGGGIGGGLGGGLVGGLGGGGLVGGFGGGLGGGLGGGQGGGRGDGFGLPKAGTCPSSNIYQELELGPYCSNDEQCHGVQKCCYVGGNGQRCQIPAEFERRGSCNHNYVIIGGRRVACNHDTTCPYGGKCCKRYSSGQVDTCTYPSNIGPYHGTPGGHGIPGGPGIRGGRRYVYPIPHLPVHGSHGYEPTYSKQSKVY
nr:loricrin isoform X2 [Crassostrea gigas]